eukprot:TRINITY_DN20572_c0_g1_i1.p1 TRINITY_DN20572_c0_g1~~TRINITY_DN20572_c0_g1_i1.p1  ORF type:complete len:386 (+),score=76.17 TRINITY_DN20572_c0_g1_i1:73-1158(+)
MLSLGRWVACGAVCIAVAATAVVEYHMHVQTTIDDLKHRLSVYERRGVEVSGCVLRRPDGKGLETGGRLQELTKRINGTDKVLPHRYDAMYSKYVTPMSGGAVRMLEIGLGCNMPHGPGHSAVLWRALLGAGLDYFVMELDRCTAKWFDTIDRAERSRAYTAEEAEWARSLVRDQKRVFWGDQSDPVFLQKVRSGLPGELDVVIDDGGHAMHHQLNSFEHLFPAVRPGGVYVIEDLETSFYPRREWGGTVRAQRAEATTVGYLRRLLNDLHWRAEKTGIAEGHEPTRWAYWVRSIDCDRGICVITKREKEFRPSGVSRRFRWPCKLVCRHGTCQCRDTRVHQYFGGVRVPPASPPPAASAS